MSQKAFTLIELLVVVAIIGVLAAFVIPAVSDSLKQSKFAKSQSNLRQIGIALQLYAQENSGFFPRATGTIDFLQNPAIGDQLSWAQQLDPYTGTNRAVFVSDYVKSFNTLPRVNNYFLGSHAAGEEALSNGQDKFQPLNQLKIQQPAKHILAGECFATWDPIDADADDYNQNNPGFAYSGPDHKVNILFADGHIEAPKRFDGTAMAVLYKGVDPLNNNYQ